MDVNARCDLVCLILKNTKDGELLANWQLSLAQDGVNGLLTEKGFQTLSKLAEIVQAGQPYKMSSGKFMYTYMGYPKPDPNPWDDIPELTYDNQGYVYWKSNEVEHYNDPCSPRMFKNLVELADRCRRIESLGLTPSTKNAIWCWDFYKDCPQNYPWEKVYHSIYTLSLCENKAIAIYALDEVKSIGIIGQNGAIELYQRPEREEYETWFEVKDSFSAFFRKYPREGWYSPDNFTGYDHFFRGFNVPVNLPEVISTISLKSTTLELHP